jgi:tetratricopeptide (TPR) repeat protein
MIKNPKRWILFVFLFLFQKSFSQAQELNYKQIDTFLKYGKYTSALQAINAYDTLLLKKNDLALLHLYKAKCLSSENNPAKAIFYFLQAKLEYKAIDSIDQAMAINIDIAYALSSNKTTRKKAEKYLVDYLNYALKEGISITIAKAYSSWASLIMEERPMERHKIFKKAIYFSEQANDDAQFENLYSKVGVLCNAHLHKPDSAIIYIDKSIAYGQKLKNKDVICINLINKASCNYYKGDFKKAIQLLKEANEIPISENSKNIKSYILQFLAVNFSELKDSKSAYVNINKSAEIRAEFNFEDQNTKISELNIKYETKEKEIENLTLKAKMQQN